MYKQVKVKTFGDSILLTSKFRTMPDHGDPVLYECSGISEIGTYVWKSRSEVGAREAGGYIRTFNGYEHGVSESNLLRIEAKHPKTDCVPGIRGGDLQRWYSARRPNIVSIELEPCCSVECTGTCTSRGTWKPRLTRKLNVRMDDQFRRRDYDACLRETEGGPSCPEQCDHCKLHRTEPAVPDRPENEGA